jgi:hypothetical protein
MPEKQTTEADNKRLKPRGVMVDPAMAAAVRKGVKQSTSGSGRKNGGYKY